MNENEKTWTTKEMQEEFDVLGFERGLVVVRRKADQQLGSLEFTHRPREYYNFLEYHDA